MRMTILLASLLLGTAPALAEQEAAPAAPAVPAAPAAPAEPAKPKMVCKVDQVTGSLIKKRRTCATAQQWNEAAVTARGEAQRLMDQTMTSPIQ